MRVLFTSTDGISKLFPLVPLAWAFRTAGHEVLVTFTDEVGMAATTGLQVIEVAPGFDSMALFTKAMEEHPGLAEVFAAPLSDDPTPLAPLLAALNRPFVDRTIETAEQWRTDLVVYEQTATYGLITAARLGVPAVQRNLGILRTGRGQEATAQYLTDVCQRYGIGALPKPATTLEYVTPSMLPFPEPEGRFMRETPFTGGAVLGDRLPQRGSRPRIAVTMGTALPGMHALAVLQPTIAAAASVDADFVLALGDGDLGAVELPANISTVGWTPLDALLRTCDAIVHHGGSMTTMAAIDAGVPQLVLLDAMHLGLKTSAPAVQMRGVGLVAMQSEVDAELLAQLVTDEKLRTATTEVQAELAGLPSPAETVPQLIELAS
jgi:calicheamicinone 4-hydroxyamino-4,6-dideoxy-alpha-D-glucosyltransferase